MDAVTDSHGPIRQGATVVVDSLGRVIALNHENIAEAVDSEPVLNRLRSRGTGYAQGRGVAAPEPLADAEGEWFSLVSRN